MANKFSGLVGYATTVEEKPGKNVEKITERLYFGDVVRSSRLSREGEQIHVDLELNKSIRIVADAFARDNMFAIRYVEWQGVLWKVLEAEPEHPRLVLRLGGVYSGPRAVRDAGN